MTSNSTKSESFFIKYLLSCASAAVAETVTYPLDITKTRLQLQNEMMLKNFVQISFGLWYYFRSTEYTKMHLGVMGGTWGCFRGV